MIISARSRNGRVPRVFCRIAGYGETVAAFLRRYYEAARRSGVIIDGRIPNPDPGNLAYFNETDGADFRMDAAFLSQRLQKWLPRMDGAYVPSVPNTISPFFLTCSSSLVAESSDPAPFEDPH